MPPDRCAALPSNPARPGGAASSRARALGKTTVRVRHGEMPLPLRARATLAAVLLLLLATRGAASEPRGPESEAERGDQPTVSAPPTEEAGGGREAADGGSSTSDGMEAGGGKETTAQGPPVNGAAEEGEDGQGKEKETEAGYCSTGNGVGGCVLSVEKGEGFVQPPPSYIASPSKRKPLSKAAAWSSLSE